MGQTSTKEEPPKVGESRAVPHINNQEQALVMRLMEDYPNLDQLMAETIVWDYFHKPKAAESEEEKGEEEEQCSVPTIGSMPDEIKSPHQTSAPSSASAISPPARPPCAVLEGSTTFVETTPPASDP